MLSFMTSFTMTTKWAVYGPQTNQLSGRIFTHNLGNSPITCCYGIMSALGEQVVLRLGPSIQTHAWMAVLPAVHQRCPIVSTSAIITLAALQWTGSLSNRFHANVGFTAAGQEGPEGLMLEYCISASAGRPPAVVTVSVVLCTIPLLLIRRATTDS